MKLETLATVEPQPIKDLSHPQIAELQTALVLLGYPAGSADGLWGPRTRNAWGEFVEDFNCTGDPNDIDSDRAAELQKALDTVVRGPEHDFSTKDGTTKAIEDECTRHGIRLKTQIAYVLATADHETNHTFRPVTEAYWLKDPDAWLKTHHPLRQPANKIVPSRVEWLRHGRRVRYRRGPRRLIVGLHLQGCAGGQADRRGRHGNAASTGGKC
jgi:peptidoglycan hydrolase-like protein with peptidoglycan-binding domain